jgi:hypothetical protein
MGVEITQQSRESTVRRLLGRDHSAFKIPVKGSEDRKDLMYV